MMETLRAFVIERGLVSIPYDLQPVVAETPAFLRWAFAMMDTPGPFEQVATEAFYYITLENNCRRAGRSMAVRVRLRSLDDISIHEVGRHYLRAALQEQPT
jgi:hypothetical protein